MCHVSNILVTQEAKALFRNVLVIEKLRVYSLIYSCFRF